MSRSLIHLSNDFAEIGGDLFDRHHCYVHRSSHLSDPNHRIWMPLNQRIAPGHHCVLHDDATLTVTGHRDRGCSDDALPLLQ